MIFIQILLSLPLLALSILLSYLWFLAISSLLIKKQITSACSQPVSRFAFVVPAHNEEHGIIKTVTNLLSVDYPEAYFDVVVVADNCEDKTAELAEKAGAVCIRRNNPQQRGKGYALSYAFSELLTKGYDAFIVIDADSIVSSDFLQILDIRMRRGEKVVQAYDGLSNPDASILTYLFQVGNLIENRLFWSPKQAYGLPIALRGNGMCFSAEVLLSYPWNAFSIVEDTEYGLCLISHNIRIHFASDMGVYATQPETLEQAFAQRVRWASGNATLTKKRALGLVINGIRERNIALFDFGISLIAGSRPLLLLSNSLLMVFAYFSGSYPLLAWATLLMLSQLAYIGLGIFLNGITLTKISRLTASPFFLAWLCMVSLLGLFGFRNTQWIRTSRQ